MFGLKKSEAKAQSSSSDLSHMLKELGDGDRSVLQAALSNSGEVEVVMMTSEGSANHKFWSQLEKRGWLNYVGRDAHVVDRGDIIIHKFSINAIGKKPIGELLGDFRLSAHCNIGKRDNSEAMAQQCSEMTNNVVPQLIATVRKNGGSPVDVAIFLANIVSTAINNVVVPEDRVALLGRVAQIADARLVKSRTH